MTLLNRTLRNRPSRKRTLRKRTRTGFSGLGVLAVLAILVGILLGPVYGAYCVFLSGKSAGTFPMSVDKPVVIELAPDMNPIRLNARVRHELICSKFAKHSRFDAV